MKQETASTVNSVLVKLIEQSAEQKAMVETVGKMVAELKLMQGKLDTMQNWQTENEQKYADMHVDYMEYKIKNEETEGQPEGQPEKETSVPKFTFGQTVPQTEQTVPTVVNAEPNAGQAQGTFVGQSESSSHFVNPSSLLSNSPSSQLSGFGPDFTFLHTPLQQPRDNNPNTPPPPFPPPVGAGSSSATPQNIFTTTTWKPKDPPCFHGKNAEDAHAWVAMVRNYFVFMAGTAQQEVAYAATLLRDVAQEWRNHGKYPHDWDTMTQAILERFGSNLRAETAQAQLQYITQGSRSVREYSAEFQLHMGRLESFDGRSLIRQFIWGLEESLAKAVTLQYPKTIHAAIGHAKAIELAELASRRPRGTSVPRVDAQSGRGGAMQRGARGRQRGGFWRRGQRSGFLGGQTTRGGGRVGPRGIGMFRGRGFPQGRSRVGLAVGGRGGRTIGAPACWTCGSTAHFSANCPRNQQTRGGGRGPRDSGFRGGRSTASSRYGVRFAGLSTV